MFWLLWLPVALAAPGLFPLVDPGLFVISGVKTCGDGGGYCLLGLDCTLDEDFLPDDSAGQHCEGLRSAFTPSAHFVCCRAANRSVYKPPVTSRTTTLDMLANEIDQVLLKVAQSVDTVKAPVTEPTQAQTDVVEVRESEGDEEHMLADSPYEVAVDSYEYPEEISTESTSSEEITSINELPKENQEEIIRNSSTKMDEPLSIVNKTTGINNLFTSNETILMNNNFSKLGEQEQIADNEHTQLTFSEIKNENAIDEPKIETTYNNKLADENKISEQKYSMNEDISSGIPATTEIIENVKSEYKSNATNLNNTIASKEDDKLKDESPLQNDIFPEESITYLTKQDEITTICEPEKTPASKNSEEPITNLSQQNKTTTNNTEFQNISDTPPSVNSNTLLKEPIILNNTEYFHTKLNETQISGTVNNHYNDLNGETTVSNEVIKSTVYNSQVEENNDALTTGLAPNSLNVSPFAKNTSTGDRLATSTVSPLNPSAVQGQAASCSNTSATNCTTEVKFLFENETLCFGSIYSIDWIVTSASCALRIFRMGMVNVSIASLTGTQASGVKTIVVHESFGEVTTQHMEPNNIGLVQLKESQEQWAPCVACVPSTEARRPSMNKCSAISTLPPSSVPNCPDKERCSATSRKSPEESFTMCQGRVRSIEDDHGLPYLTLPCDTMWDARVAINIVNRDSGAPLVCDGILTGIQGSTGIGMQVYTPLTPYLPWLHRHTRPEKLFTLS